MTITTEACTITGLGNGATTVWSYNFIVPYQADGVSPAVSVAVYDTTVSPATMTTLSPGDYTITGVEVPAGGTITYPLSGSPLATGQSIIISRDLEYVQPFATPNSTFYPLTVEALGDWIVEQTQQLNEVQGRSIRFPVGETVATLPLPGVRAGGVLGFDDNGNLITSGVVSGTLISSTMIPFVQSNTLLEAANILAQGPLALADWDSVSTSSGVMDITSKATNVVRSGDTSDVTSLGVGAPGDWRLISCESNRLFIQSATLYFMFYQNNFRSTPGDLLLAKTEDGTHWNVWLVCDAIWKRADAAPSLGAGDYVVGFGEDLGTIAPDFEVDQRTDQVKVRMKSIIMGDPGDTPEMGMFICDGTPSAPVKWTTPYAGCFPAYGWPIVDNAGNTATMSAGYENSEFIGRNAQINMPVDGPNLGAHSTPGAIELCNCPINKQTPFARAFSVPAGGWVFQGKAVEAAILAGSLTYPYVASLQHKYSPVTGLNWYDFVPIGAVTLISTDGVGEYAESIRKFNALSTGYTRTIHFGTGNLRYGAEVAGVVTDYIEMTSAGHYRPVTSVLTDLGGSSNRWREYYGVNVDLSRATDAAGLKVLNTGGTFSSDLVQFDTTRAANAAFNLLRFACNGVVIAKVGGLGDALFNGVTTTGDIVPLTDNTTSWGTSSFRPASVFARATDLLRTTDNTVLKILASNATQTADVIQADTTRAANAAFKFIRGAANGVEQWYVKGDGTASFLGGMSIGTTCVIGGTTGSTVGTDPISANTPGWQHKADGTFTVYKDGNVTCAIGRKTSDGGVINFYRDTTNVGSVSVTTTATAYNTSSDEDLKEDLKPVDISIFAKLKPVDFAWKVNGTRAIGFIAHELQEVMPSAVTGERGAVDEKGNRIYQMVDLSKLVPLLVAKIQELEGRLAALEA